ncbi:glycosyltransferase [Polynucleobacter sp. UK-FUSCHL-C3]|uniref:Glycosyltransferase n=1 Tax=Polynucleobacter sp. UK-FUSCHL-C3 TaxID=2955208 RepID=A0AAU8A328_9BURK
MVNKITNKLNAFITGSASLQSLLRWILSYILAPILRLTGWGNQNRKSVLYVGQAYYNNWYLSRALRKLDWTADLLNWDLNQGSQIYYHGEDFRIEYKSHNDVLNFFKFYLKSLSKYDVFHFANKGGLQFGQPMSSAIKKILNEEGFEIRFLKALGKKIVYSNNGCLDGVSQTAFSQWGSESVCSICRWQNEPAVCSDERNLAWGKFRNEVADYQCLLGGNRVDYNDDPRVHEVPEFYCLDKEFWHPNIEIPEKYRLPALPFDRVRLYHAVGHRAERTSSDGVNIKSSHIYLPLINQLRNEGHHLDLIEPSGIPNREVVFLQAQADIFLDMLTYGWFGANAREAMMLGKPVICFLRPEWLESARKEIPNYIDELPVVSATPQTVKAVLLDLIMNKEKRLKIGRDSRLFAEKWHSAEAGARRFDRIYSELLGLNS